MKIELNVVRPVENFGIGYPNSFLKWIPSPSMYDPGSKYRGAGVGGCIVCELVDA